MPISLTPCYQCTQPQTGTFTEKFNNNPSIRWRHNLFIVDITNTTSVSDALSNRSEISPEPIGRICH